MEKQVVRNLLVTGVLLCTLLTGCAGEELSGNTMFGGESLLNNTVSEERTVVSLQDLAVDMASVGENSENKRTGTEGDTEGAVEKQGEKEDESWASAKELLATFPNSLEELAALEEEYPIYIILHGIQNSGEENLKTFREKLEAGEAAELIVVQFTVEGDAILDYYDYEGALMYRWQDISRDGFGGTGEKYFETVYEAAWFSEEADTEGNLYLFFNGLCEGDMVVELFRSDAGQKCPDFQPDYDDRAQDGIEKPMSTLPPWAKPPASQEKQNGTETSELDTEIPVASFEAEICDLPLAK